MPTPTAVILTVGLSPSLLPHAPNLRAYAEKSRLRTLTPPLPAVTCPVQSSVLTGLPPRGHGVVANGWYDRALGEVHFWKQSNALVRGEKLWQTARRRDHNITCANLFWWFNMYPGPPETRPDYSVTPRPIYKADGRKLPDIYTDPPELRTILQDPQTGGGGFPLFNFWGPAANIRSSQWIADATLAVYDLHRPTLTLTYLPHLDYPLQRLGPDHPDIPAEVAQLDQVAGNLIAQFQNRGVRPLVLSEYGIEHVTDFTPCNAFLRAEGVVSVREEDGRELLDPLASQAFALPDHQTGHVYVNDQRNLSRIKALCESMPNVEHVLDRQAQAAHAIDHERAGDLFLIASPGTWLSYNYWLDDAKAPDFARTVDIHRKPGYDPLELFLDPALRFPKLTIARKLLARKLGIRNLLDVIPLDPSLVKGSHGRVNVPAALRPILITPDLAGASSNADTVPAEAVRDIILDHLFEDNRHKSG